MGLGLIVFKKISEAVAFNVKAVMRYAIDNSLFESHGRSRVVQIIVHNTSENKMLARIRRRVGQIEKAAWERMGPISNTGPKCGVVPGNAKGHNTYTVVDSIDTEEDISP
jgi:hypothetical protein